MTKIKPHKIDVFLIILFPVLATLLTLIFHTNFLISTLLFFGIPSLYLSFRKPGIVSKSLIFAAIFSVPFSLVVDYLAVVDKSWFVPNTIFGSRFLGVIPIEDFVWGFLWVFFATLFYEYFLDRGSGKDRINKNIKYLIIFLLSLLIIFFLFLFISPDLLNIKYFYLKVGIVLVLVPVITVLSFFPKLAGKYLKIGVYFFGLSLLFELVGLRTNQWTFPGSHFIGYIELFGLKFPFEEFLFWLVLGVAAVLSYYEFFVDDKK